MLVTTILVGGSAGTARTKGYNTQDFGNTELAEQFNVIAISNLLMIYESQISAKSRAWCQALA